MNILGEHRSNEHMKPILRMLSQNVHKAFITLPINQGGLNQSETTSKSSIYRFLTVVRIRCLCHCYSNDFILDPQCFPFKIQSVPALPVLLLKSMGHTMMNLPIRQELTCATHTFKQVPQGTLNITGYNYSLGAFPAKKIRTPINIPQRTVSAMLQACPATPQYVHNKYFPCAEFSKFAREGPWPSESHRRKSHNIKSTRDNMFIMTS